MARNEQSQHLTPTQQRAITALLAERDVKSAAVVASVGESTLRRWLRENVAFKKALREAQSDLFGESTRLLARLQTAAAVALANVMADPTAQDGARVSAARAILDAGDRRIAGTDLEAKLDEMEAALMELGGKL